MKDMIPHHKIAIVEAKKVLKTAKDPFVKSLASAIIKAQESEIEEMTARLKEDGQSVSGGSAAHGGMKMGKSVDWNGAFAPVIK